MLKKLFMTILLVSLFSTFAFGGVKEDLDSLELTINDTFTGINNALGRTGTSNYIKGQLALLRNTLRRYSADISWDIPEVKKQYPGYTFKLPTFPAQLEVSTYDKMQEQINTAYKTTLKDIEKAQFELGKQKYYTAITILLSAFFTFKSTFDAATGTDAINIVQLPSNLKSMVDDAKNNAKQIEKGVNNIEQARANLGRITKFKEDLIKIMHETRKVKKQVVDLHHELEIFKYTWTNFVGTVQSGNRAQVSSSAPLPKPENITGLEDAKKKIQTYYSAFESGEIPFTRYSGLKYNTVRNAVKAYSPLSLQYDGRTGEFYFKFEGQKTTLTGYYRSKGSQNVSAAAAKDSFISWCRFDSGDFNKFYTLNESLYQYAAAWDDLLNSKMRGALEGKSTPSVSVDLREVKYGVGTYAYDLNNSITANKDFFQKQAVIKTERAMGLIANVVRNYSKRLSSASLAFPESEGYAGKIRKVHYDRNAYVNARDNIGQISALIKDLLQKRETFFNGITNIPEILNSAEEILNNYNMIVQGDGALKYLGSKLYYPGTNPANRKRQTYSYRMADPANILGNGSYILNIQDIKSAIKYAEEKTGEEAEITTYLLRQMGGELDLQLDAIFRRLNAFDENALAIKSRISELSSKLGGSSILASVIELEKALGAWMQAGKPESGKAAVESLCDKIISDSSDKNEFLTNFREAVKMFGGAAVYMDIAEEMKTLAEKIPELAYFPIKNITNMNAFKNNLMYYDTDGKNISNLAFQFNSYLTDMNPALKAFDGGDKNNAYKKIMKINDYASNTAQARKATLENDPQAKAIYNTITKQAQRCKTEMEQAEKKALAGIKSATATVRRYSSYKSEIIRMEDYKYSSMITKCKAGIMEAMGLYGDYFTTTDGPVKNAREEIDSIIKRFVEWRKIRNVKARIMNFSVNGEYYPIENTSVINVYKENLDRGMIVISGMVDSNAGPEVKKVYFKSRSRNGYVYPQNGTFTIAFRAPLFSSDIYVSLEMENDIGVRSDPYNYTIKYDAVAYTKLVAKKLEAMVSSYKRKDLSGVLKNVSDEYYGSVNLLSEALRNDFSNFNNIQLKIYTDAVIPSEMFIEARTHWDMVYVDSSGKSNTRSGNTVMVFTVGSNPMLLNSFGTVLFGASKASPFDAGSQVVYGTSYLYDYTGYADGEIVKVLDLETGATPTFPSYAISSYLSQFDFACSNRFYTGAGGGMIDLGVVNFDSVKEAPATGYTFNENQLPTSFIGHVFAVKTRSGFYAKVRITNAWVGGSGNDQFHTTVDWAIQKDGSNRF